MVCVLVLNHVRMIDKLQNVHLVGGFFFGFFWEEKQLNCW